MGRLRRDAHDKPCGGADCADDCDAAGIGSVPLNADVGVTILDVSRATAGEGSAAIPYCLVKVLVPEAINIWVGLPMGGRWNGSLESVGNAGYAGAVTAPLAAVAERFVGVSTDTGHTGRSGGFGMASPPGESTDACLSETEAVAISKIWEGPVLDGKRLWFAPRPGSASSGLANFVCKPPG